MRTPDREMRLCAGLPFIGERTLEETELGALKRESGIYMTKAFALILLIPFLIVLFPWSIWHEDWIRSSIPYVGEYATTIVLFGCVFGLPLTIFLSRDLFRNEDVLMRTIASGTVRCFEGQLNVDDKTDSIRSFLTKKGLLNIDSHAANRIELFGEDDIIYEVNGKRPSKLLAVEVTSAALPDPSPPHFSIPTAWGISESDIDLERRRLSEGEIEEVRSYAKENWRYVRYLFLIGIAVFGITEIFTFGFFEMEPHRNHLVSAGCAIAICVAIFYRRKGWAERLELDAENGWALTYCPPKGDQEDQGKAGPAAPVEFLPFSNFLWIVDGKPAGWRRNRAKPG